MKIRFLVTLLLGTLLATVAFTAEEMLVNADLTNGLNGWKMQSASGVRMEYVTGNGAPMLTILSDKAPSPKHGWKITADAKKLSAFPQDKELEFSFTANTFGDPSVKFQAAVTFLREGKVLSRPLMQASIYAGWQKESLRFKRPAEPFDSVVAEIRLVTSGHLRAYDAHLSEAAPLPVSANARTARDFARVTDFPSRNTYWNTTPASITIEGYCPAAALKITLSEIAGKSCGDWTWSVPVRKAFSRTLALPRLAPGAYQLTMVSEAGDETLTEVELFRIRQGNPNQGVTFSHDRFMRLDGKPFFPIGMTHIPVDDPDKFRVYAASGINFVCVFELGLSKTWTDYYRKVLTENNLASVSWDGYASRYNCGMIERDLKRRIGLFATVPKFIGVMDDESAWLNCSIARVRENNAMFFKCAPDYLIWGNNAPRVSYDPAAPDRQAFAHLKRYYRTYEVTGLDIYPVPAGKVGHNNLPNKTLSAIGDYTDIANQVGQDHLPIWMCLQGFGWGEQGGRNNLAQLPRPDYNELRFMTYDAVVHGATGIVWHSEGGKGGHGPADEVYDEWWTHFADVNRELAVVGQFLSSGNRVELPGAPEGIRWIARNNGKDSLLIAVNESGSAVSFKNPLAGKYYCSPKGILAGDTGTLAPYSVAVLSTFPIAIAPTRRFTPQPHHFTAGVPCKGTFKLDADYLFPPAAKPGWGAFTARFPVKFTEKPRSARIRINSQREWAMKINGKEFHDRTVPGFSVPNWYYLFEYDLMPYLQIGENLIDVTAWAGYLACEIEIDGQIVARTDAATQVARNGKDNWMPGRSLGRMGTVKSLRVPLCRLSDCR